MARTVAKIAGGARVTDFISLGVLSKRIPVEQVERVLRETERESERQRKLPMHVMVYYVIALGLYMQVSYGEVLRCLLEGLEWLGLPVKSIRTVQMSSISRARMRLGVEPLKRLYEELVVPVATPKTRGAWYRGRKLVSIDGSTLDVADTEENEKAFGRPGASRGKAGFPKLRLVSLVENGT
ncbi:MAG: IS4 family transposase, partial [Gemmatimonas sp.]|nr:IS4 family transposase [Gemmatimonas sp.]